MAAIKDVKVIREEPSKSRGLVDSSFLGKQLKIKRLYEVHVFLPEYYHARDGEFPELIYTGDDGGENERHYLVGRKENGTVRPILRIKAIERESDVTIGMGHLRTICDYLGFPAGNIDDYARGVAGRVFFENNRFYCNLTNQGLSLDTEVINTKLGMKGTLVNDGVAFVLSFDHLGIKNKRDIRLIGDSELPKNPTEIAAMVIGTAPGTAQRENVHYKALLRDSKGNYLHAGKSEFQHGPFPVDPESHLEMLIHGYARENHSRGLMPPWEHFVGGIGIGHVLYFMAYGHIDKNLEGKEAELMHKIEEARKYREFMKFIESEIVNERPSETALRAYEMKGKEWESIMEVPRWMFKRGSARLGQALLYDAVAVPGILMIGGGWPYRWRKELFDQEYVGMIRAGFSFGKDIRSTAVVFVPHKAAQAIGAGVYGFAMRDNR